MLSDSFISIMSKKSLGLFGLTNDNKFLLVCSITKDISNLFNAGSIISEIATNMGNKGGGSKHMATTSFKSMKELEKSIDLGLKLIRNKCN